MKSPAPLVAFRADGSQLKGLGHIKRCETLARDLLRRGCRVCFITTVEPFVVDYLSRAGFETKTIEPANDRAEMFENSVAAVAELKPGLVFLDILNTEPEFIAGLKSAGARVVAMDDLGPGAAVADALVGVDIGMLDELVTDDVRKGTKIYAGLDYAIISDEFRGLRGTEDKLRFSNRRIFICFGGSDPRGSTAPVIEQLLGWDADFEAHVVIGPCMENPCEVEELAARDKKRFRVYHNPPELPRIMADSAVAFCGVGQSLFELSMFGVPCLLITQSPLHARFAENFKKRGSGIHLGPHDGFNPADVVKWCGKILDDESLWSKMSGTARDLIDGNGASRICDVIMGLL